MAWKVGKWSLVSALLLFLIMLAGIASANLMDFGWLTNKQALLACAGTVGGVTWWDWFPVTLVAILAGIMFPAIAQIISGAVSSDKVNGFVKERSWDLFETLGLLAVFSVMLTVLEPFAVDRLDTARAYAVLIKNTVMFDFGMTVAASMVMGFVSNAAPHFKLPGPAFVSLSFQFGPMFKPLNDMLGILLQLITTSVVMWSAQEFLICFIKSTMLVILIPTGFLLRAIGIKAGANALLGIGLSLYFIYPQMVIMVGETVTTHFMNDIERYGYGGDHVLGTCLNQPICCFLPGGATPSSPDAPFLMNGKNWNAPWPQSQADRVSVEKVNEGVFNMEYDSQTTTGTNNWCMYNTVMGSIFRGSIVTKLQSLGWGVAAGGAGFVGLAFALKYANISWLSFILSATLMNFALGMVNQVAYFGFVVSIVMPIFIIFVTLTMAKDIAKVLGTEIDLSSLEKLL